jgi:hypothetical protein
MDLNTTIDIIIRDLNEAGQIIDDLKSVPGVPLLQVELAKLKCKTASDVIALLKKVPEAKVIKEAAPVQEVKPEKKVEMYEIKQPPEAAVRPVTPVKSVKTTGERTASVLPPVEREEPKQAVKKTGEQTIIADQFSNMPESFNESLGSMKHEDDVLEVLKTKRVATLAEAIGINDKFLFIREIFDGNQEDYNQAISRLDSVGNLGEALTVIMSYTGDNTENEAIHQLLDIIKRKFPSHE